MTMGPRTVAQFQAETNYQNDAGFKAFVEKVTPKGEVEQVWLGTVLAILELLWKLYQIGKSLGWWSRFKLRAATREVMVRYAYPTWREAELKALAEKWGK